MTLSRHKLHGLWNTVTTLKLYGVWDTVTWQTAWCVGNCHITDIMVCGTLLRHRQHVCAFVRHSRHRQHVGAFVGHSRHRQHGVWDTVTPQTTLCVGHCEATDLMVCRTLLHHRQHGVWRTVTSQTSWCVGHCHATDTMVCVDSHATDSMFVQFVEHSRHRQHDVWDTVTLQTAWYVGHCYATDIMVGGILSRHGHMVCGDTVTPQTAWRVGHCDVTDMVCGTLSRHTHHGVRGHCHATDSMFVQSVGHCHATDIMVCRTLSHHRQNICAVCGTLSRHRHHGVWDTVTPQTGAREGKNTGFEPPPLRTLVHPLDQAVTRKEKAHRASTVHHRNSATSTYISLTLGVTLNLIGWRRADSETGKQAGRQAGRQEGRQQ